MDRQSNTSSEGTCLQAQIVQLLHQHCFGSQNSLQLKEAAAALLAIYDEPTVQSACVELQHTLPPALTPHTQTFEQFTALLLERPQPLVLDSQEALTAVTCGRIKLLWQQQNDSAIVASYSSLIKSVDKHAVKTTTQLWHINDLLSWLALDNHNPQLSRTSSMQAMFCARGTEDLEKIEKSNFALACALSIESPTATLRDNFVEIRSSVLGNISRLDAYQQHLVLLYSARDFIKRDMLASARWVLDISAEYFSSMLPEQQHMFHSVNMRYYAKKNRLSEAREAYNQAKRLAEKENFQAHLSDYEFAALCAEEKYSSPPTQDKLLAEFIDLYKATTQKPDASS